MAIEVTRLNCVIGAIVSGVDLARELPRSVIDRLGELMVEHQVLFFRNQPITPQEQRDFAAHFGTLHIHPIYPVLPELPEIMLLDTHAGFLPDNDNWHTDVTFSTTPPLAGILAAKSLPPVGGDTLWSSCSAAYDALSEPLRRFLEGLTAQHSVAKSFPPNAGKATPPSRSDTIVPWPSIRRSTIRWCARTRSAAARGYSSMKDYDAYQRTEAAGEPNSARLPLHPHGATGIYGQVALERR